MAESKAFEKKEEKNIKKAGKKIKMPKKITKLKNPKNLMKIAFTQARKASNK